MPLFEKPPLAGMRSSHQKRSFPHPVCFVCGRYDECLTNTGQKSGQSGRPKGYPSCRTPLTRTSMKRMEELCSWITRAHSVEDSRVEEMFGVVRERFERDRESFSEVFEPSVSYSRPKSGTDNRTGSGPDSRIDSGYGLSLLRFSYAFPGFRDSPGEVAASLERLCRPFGSKVMDGLRSVLLAAGSPSVHMPLFGFAWDGPKRQRTKLYLQFHDDAGHEALAMAGQVTGCGGLPSLFHGESLHLLGLDLGERGLVEAKLYFRIPLVNTLEREEPGFPSWTGSVPLIAFLGGKGCHSLWNVLTIHRMKGPEDSSVRTPSEVDFSLPENELSVRDMASFDGLSPIFSSGMFADLMNAFRIAVRRVSVPVGHVDKANVYYVLTER